MSYSSFTYAYGFREKDFSICLITSHFKCKPTTLYRSRMCNYEKAVLQHVHPNGRVEENVYVTRGAATSHPYNQSCKHHPVSVNGRVHAAPALALLHFISLHLHYSRLPTCAYHICWHQHGAVFHGLEFIHLSLFVKYLCKKEIFQTKCRKLE